MGAHQNVGLIQCDSAINQHNGYILASTKYNINENEAQGTCVDMYLCHRPLKPLHTNINIHQPHTII